MARLDASAPVCIYMSLSLSLSLSLSVYTHTHTHTHTHTQDELQSVHVMASPSSVQIMLDGKEMKGYLHETDWRAPAAGRSRIIVIITNI
jgi:hypothetical protein